MNSLLNELGSTWVVDLSFEDLLDDFDLAYWPAVFTLCTALRTIPLAEVC